MIQSFTNYIACICVAFLIVSCGNNKHTQTGEKLPKIKSQVLIEQLDKMSVAKPEFFYSKISSKYKDSKYKVSFKTSVKMRKDSALNATITFANIPIYNTMVTPDTLKMVDKRGKCYTVESVSYLKKTFGINFEHANIEEFLLGMPVGWDVNEKYHQINDPYNYIVSSHNKRQLKKTDDERARDVFIQYYLTDDAKSIKRILIDSPSDTTHIKIDYLSRQVVDGYDVPDKAEILVETPADTLFIDLEYNKVAVNTPKRLYLAIPSKYDECK